MATGPANWPTNWFEAIETINAWVAADRQETRRSGRRPTLEALAQRLGVSPEEARRVIDLAMIKIDIP